MSQPLVSYIVATHNRKDCLRNTIKSILAQNYPNWEIIVISDSTDGTSALFRKGSRFGRPEINYLHFDSQLGVSEARNIGFRNASGDIYISIDDDAVFKDDEVTTNVVTIFEHNPELGVVAFRSEDYYTGIVSPAEFPDPPINDRNPAEAFETTFFIGVGNAIRSEALDRAGTYPPSFEYGFEELDLSFRLLDAGYRIRYDPTACVRHRNSSSGRRSDSVMAKHRLTNRIKTTVRNLPWRYVVVSTFLWTIHSFFTIGVRTTTSALRAVFDDGGQLLTQRRVIERETIRKIKGRSGPLYWWWFGTPPTWIAQSLNRLLNW